MRLLLPARLSAVSATARLLFTTHPRAFIISALGTLIEPLFYPTLLLILHQILQAITGPGGIAAETGALTASGIALIALLLIQRLAIIMRDGSSNMLRQQAWVAISTRIMHKLPSVPYSLFENNAFQARYGLVIREAAQQSITLVDSLLSTLPILLGVLGLAATLFALAPLIVVALVVIAIPALLTERRLSHAMYSSHGSRTRRLFCLPPIATTPFARLTPSRCWLMAVSRRWAPMTNWSRTPASSGRCTWPRARLLWLTARRLGAHYWGASMGWAGSHRARSDRSE